MTGPERPDAPEVELVPVDDRVVGVVFRWSLAAFALVAAVVAAVLLLGRRAEPAPEVVARAPVAAPRELAAAVATPLIPFADVTASAGIDFVRVNGATGGKLLPETMGGGGAFFDLEGDGDPDLVLVNGRSWHGVASDPPGLALYRNDGDGRFSDVTVGSGLDARRYGMGVAAGDIDNDGRVDLFVTALGTDALYRNLGDGRFAEVTAAAGVGGGADEWSSGAGFLDYDGDGFLDLFVATYVAWSEELDRDLAFTVNGRDRAYGPPKQYPGTYCRLYRNRGDGRFTDVSAAAGVRVDNPSTKRPMAKALAVTFADVDGNGAVDIFVANDTVDNFLFLNRGDGTFDEVGRSWGVATDSNGNATGAMGADLAHHHDDPRLAIAVGNFANEATSLFVQGAAGGTFADLAGLEGIGSPSRLALTFGLFFFDADLDGRLDLLQANGHLEDEINEVQPSQTYRQAAQLFWNGGQRRRGFACLPAAAIGDLATPIVGRGASYADVDGDGDLDVLLTQPSGSPLLLRNEQRLGHHWLRVRLVGGHGVNRDAIGSWVECTTAAGTQRRQVMPTRSYLSQVELPLTFGLGRADAVTSLVVTWPDGRRQEVAAPAVDTTVTVRRAPG